MSSLQISLLLWGRETCPRCVQSRAELDGLGVDYGFRCLEKLLTGEVSLDDPDVDEVLYLVEEDGEQLPIFQFGVGGDAVFYGWPRGLLVLRRLICP